MNRDLNNYLYLLNYKWLFSISFICLAFSAYPSVPSFSSPFSSFASSSAPLSSCPPLPPAPTNPKARPLSVGEPGSGLTRPTSLPSAPETGTGRVLSEASSHLPIQIPVTSVSPFIPSCSSLLFPASWQSEWRPPKSQAPLAQPAISPKFLHLSAKDPGKPAVPQKKQIEMPCNAPPLTQSTLLFSLTLPALPVCHSFPLI